MEEEIWKDVVGYEGLYQISNTGRVKTFWLGTKSDGFLRPFINNSGYKTVHLTNQLKQKKAFLIHRLVGVMFIEKILQELDEINHKDGNKLNNKPENLEWVTHFNQMQHAHQTGLIDYSKRRGDKCWKAKLTWEQVREIREAHIPWKMSFSMLAEKYNVSRGTIAFIVANKSWKQDLQGGNYQQ